jgi:rfaE bifunctional protein kinase chain/domain
MSKINLDELFASFKHSKIGVVGDVMLDSYWWGRVDRISPEAPVPIVALDKRETRIGGAGNVALNLASLGVSTSIFSVIGADATGLELQLLLKEKGIDTRWLVESPTRKTTNKTRIICRNQQMMRLDDETTADINIVLQEELLAKLNDYIITQHPKVIILEDYNKGVLTEALITKIIALCKQHTIITTVDPKRKNFFSYKGVSVFKPNLKEVVEGLGVHLAEVNAQSLRNIHQLLKKQLKHSVSFITLSEKGVFCQENNTATLIPSHLRNIADVSGAGDTVIAVASLIYAATKDVQLMAAIANIAGGLVCEEVGTAAINKQLLLQECKRLLT